MVVKSIIVNNRHIRTTFMKLNTHINGIGFCPVLCISEEFKRAVTRYLVTDRYHILIINFPLIMEKWWKRLLDL